jgi:phage-related protein
MLDLMDIDHSLLQRWQGEYEAMPLKKTPDGH